MAYRAVFLPDRMQVRVTDNSKHLGDMRRVTGPGKKYRRMHSTKRSNEESKKLSILQPPNELRNFLATILNCHKADMVSIQLHFSNRVWGWLRTNTRRNEKGNPSATEENQWTRNNEIWLH